jgi:hypothetical protein
MYGRCSLLDIYKYASLYDDATINYEFHSLLTYLLQEIELPTDRVAETTLLLLTSN